MAGAYVILGASVLGMTTAVELKKRHPHAEVVVLAKHFAGEDHADYTSDWAGADHDSSARDSGPEENWDRVTYAKLAELADTVPECPVYRADLRKFYHAPREMSDLYSHGTGKIWYAEMCDLRVLDEDELEAGARFGLEWRSFVLDVPKYLQWLQGQAQTAGVDFVRQNIVDINDVFVLYPGTQACFNCTGLGSLTLKGVEDQDMYPTRGQTVLVANTDPPLTKLYCRSQTHSSSRSTYVFPRGPDPSAGIILGGSFDPHDWNRTVDPELAADIMQRACDLVPQLGRPEELKVIRHQVGLRPSRKGGARLERTTLNRHTIIHVYGIGGAGYQASWGMAKDAVDLLDQPASALVTGKT